MLTTAGRDAALATLGGFVGLIKAISNFRTGSVTEAAYTGYGTRPAIAYGAAADTSPAGGRQVSNSGTVTMPKNTGADEVSFAFGIWSAATAGTLGAIGFLGGINPLIGTADDIAGDTIVAPAHGFAADTRVFVLAAPGAPLPAGLSENTAYFVLASGLTTDVFKLSTTSGGSAVNITGNGAAMFCPYVAQTVATNATPSFAATTLIIQV